MIHFPRFAEAEPNALVSMKRQVGGRDSHADQDLGLTPPATHTPDPTTKEHRHADQDLGLTVGSRSSQADATD